MRLWGHAVLQAFHSPREKRARSSRPTPAWLPARPQADACGTSAKFGELNVTRTGPRRSRGSWSPGAARIEQEIPTRALLSPPELFHKKRQVLRTRGPTGLSTMTLTHSSFVVKRLFASPAREPFQSFVRSPRTLRTVRPWRQATRQSSPTIIDSQHGASAMPGPR